jgi:hypothetical protein
MLWSMEVSHGVSEYGRSTEVSLGVLEYHLEYRSIGISECRYFLDCCNIDDSK